MYVCIDVYGFLDKNDSTCFFVYSIMTFLILYITLYNYIKTTTHKVPNHELITSRQTRENKRKITHTYC